MGDLFTELEPARGLRPGLVVRRAVVGALAAVAVVALANVAGQQPATARAEGDGATLELEAPSRVRGGLFFQARLDVRAQRRIADPRLVLDRGWTERLQVNSIEPAPAAESSRNGALVLSYDALAAGETLRIWFQFQVEPTAIGTRPFGLRLDDGTTPQAVLDHDVTVLP